MQGYRYPFGSEKICVPDGEYLLKPYLSSNYSCDGNIDMSDIVLIMQALANPNKYGINGTDSRRLTDQGSLNADVDTSTSGITGNDALLI